MKFCFGDGSKKTAHSAKTCHSCFDEINACANVSFRMISFRLVFTWQLSLEMELHFCQNDRREITTTVILILSYNRNWPATEMNIFDFTRNENSCKHAPNYNRFSWLVVFIMGIWRPHCPKQVQLLLFFEFWLLRDCYRKNEWYMIRALEKNVKLNLLNPGQIITVSTLYI